MDEEEIKNIIQKSLGGYFFWINNLHESNQYLKLASEYLIANDHLKFNALLDSSVMSYCRLFRKSGELAGKGFKQIDKNIVFKSGVLLAMHQEVMDYGNRVIAHDDQHSSREHRLTIDKNKNGEMIVGTGCIFTLQGKFIEKITILNKELGNYVGPYGNKKMRQLSEKYKIPIRMKTNKD